LFPIVRPLAWAGLPASDRSPLERVVGWLHRHGDEATSVGRADYTHLIWVGWVHKHRPLVTADHRIHLVARDAVLMQLVFVCWQPAQPLDLHRASTVSSSKAALAIAILAAEVLGHRVGLPDALG